MTLRPILLAVILLPVSAIPLRAAMQTHAMSGTVTNVYSAGSVVLPAEVTTGASIQVTFAYSDQAPAYTLSATHADYWENTFLNATLSIDTYRWKTGAGTLPFEGIIIRDNDVFFGDTFNMTLSGDTSQYDAFPLFRESVGTGSIDFNLIDNVSPHEMINGVKIPSNLVLEYDLSAVKMTSGRVGLSRAGTALYNVEFELDVSTLRHLPEPGTISLLIAAGALFLIPRRRLLRA